MDLFWRDDDLATSCLLLSSSIMEELAYLLLEESPWKDLLPADCRWRLYLPMVSFLPRLP